MEKETRWNYFDFKINNYDQIITARKRSLGNIFSSVCQGFCSQGGCLVPGRVCGDPPPRWPLLWAVRDGHCTHATGMHSCYEYLWLLIIHFKHNFVIFGSRSSENKCDENIPVGCVPPAFLIQDGCLCAETPLDRDPPPPKEHGTRDRDSLEETWDRAGRQLVKSYRDPPPPCVQND